jgi:hypothetical protein
LTFFYSLKVEIDTIDSLEGHWQLSCSLRLWKGYVCFFLMSFDSYTTPPQQLYNTFSHGVSRKMINVHHMYNKGTTPLSHGVGSTNYRAHPIWEGCCTIVVHVMYVNHLSGEPHTLDFIPIWKNVVQLLWWCCKSIIFHSLL